MNDVQFSIVQDAVMFHLREKEGLSQYEIDVTLKSIYMIGQGPTTRNLSKGPRQKKGEEILSAIYDPDHPLEDAIEVMIGMYMHLSEAYSKRSAKRSFLFPELTLLAKPFKEYKKSAVKSEMLKKASRRSVLR